MKGSISLPRAAGCTLIIAIAEAQAFADGNKRTAMQAGMMFLDYNGLRFAGDVDLLAVLIEEAASTPQDEAIDRLVTWLHPQMEPTP